MREFSGGRARCGDNEADGGDGRNRTLLLVPLPPLADDSCGLTVVARVTVRRFSCEFAPKVELFDAMTASDATSRFLPPNVTFWVVLVEGEEALVAAVDNAGRAPAAALGSRANAGFTLALRFIGGGGGGGGGESN